MLGVKEKNHKFTPDGLSEELVAKYRKQLWDDAHNKSCVNIPLLVESDIEVIKTDGGQYLLAFRIPRAQYGNPVIQKMFVFLGVDEKGSTGDDVIAKGWKDNGWSIPTVEEKSNPDRIETCLKLERNIKDITETSTITTETTTKTPSVTTETPADTTETILKIISNNPKVTAKEIATVCGITEDGVAYHIKKLKQRGRLIRIGGSRNGGEWKVVE